MPATEIRYVGGTTFVLEDGNEIFVTNKYSILSGPRDWLADVRLASLAAAMRVADEPDADTLYVSTDPPERFDAKYPGHILSAHIIRSSTRGRIRVGVSLEKPQDERTRVSSELRTLLAPVIERHRGSGFELDWSETVIDLVTVEFEIPIRGKAVSDALEIGAEVEALVGAAEGDRLTRTSCVDLVRSGFATALIGQPEGPWFDGKSAPYRVADDAQKWELAKDVAAFANAESGGVLVLGARTSVEAGSDVVRSIQDFDLSLFSPARYRAIVRARVHPRVFGLEIRAIPTADGRCIGFLHVPPQREEARPFLVKGVVVSGSIRNTHVSLPTRDGEDTRYTEPAEIHSLLQAGRVALQRGSH